MSITQILQNESMILPQENILQRNRNRNGEDLFPLLFFIFYVVISLILCHLNNQTIFASYS